MKKMLFGLLIFFTAGISHAYTAKGPIGCGVYVADFDKDGWDKIANEAWFVGVITGYNLAMSADVGKGVDNASITLHVYNYCKTNPLKTTADAAEDLISNLLQRS